MVNLNKYSRNRAVSHVKYGHTEQQVMLSCAGPPGRRGVKRAAEIPQQIEHSLIAFFGCTVKQKVVGSGKILRTLYISTGRRCCIIEANDEKMAHHYER